VFALIDCNSMYASCEQIFRPDLRGKPVAVLSNNDGCIVSLNEEAKAAGIQKFAPYFQVADQCKMAGVNIFSSNYELYGDISNRVMCTIQDYCPETSVYSIDESFASFHGFSHGDMRETGLMIKKAIWRDTRMPVCVGIAPTKTLAKLANHIAKKHPRSAGVCFLRERDQTSAWLKRIDVSNVWGVGRQLTKQLRAININTAYDLSACDHRQLRRMFNVLLEATARELAGVPCLELHEAPPQHRSIMVSRAFSQKITSYTDLRAALSSYSQSACEKLRRLQGVVTDVMVSASSSPFDSKKHHASIHVRLSHPTSNTMTIATAVSNACGSLFRDGVQFARAGVMFPDVVHTKHIQTDLFSHGDKKGAENLMSTLDKLNAHNSRKITIASSGLNRIWQTRRKFKSPDYTTNIDELPMIRC